VTQIDRPFTTFFQQRSFLLAVLSHPHADAVQWWHSKTSRSRSCDACVTLPAINTILLTLIDLSPPLLLLYDSRQPDSAFWELFRKVLKLLQRSEAPDPHADFPGFVDRLYLLRERISFSRVEDLALLTEAMPMNTSPEFWLWRFPARIDNPPLFFETLSFLHATASAAWNRFISSPGALDQLFDRFLPYVAYGGLSATAPLARNLHFITTLFVERHRLLANFVDLTERFWARVVSLIGLTNPTIATIAFRTATFLFTISRGHFPSDHHEAWLMDLVAATPTPSVVHLQVLNFVIQAKLPNFKYLRLAMNMLSQGIREVADYSFLKRLLMLPQMEKPLLVIQSLFLTAINDRIFGKTAALIVREPFLRFSDHQTFITWGTLFVRRAFTFVGLAAAARRYHAKRTRVFNLFDGLQEMRVDWLNKMVLRYYASLVNTERIPHTVVGFARDKIIDFKFVSEIDVIPRQSVNLKTYLGGACDPEVTDLAPSKPKTPTKDFAASKRSPIISRNAKSPRLRKPIPTARGLNTRTPSCSRAALLRA
jgi:hypothetical protein